MSVNVGAIKFTAKTLRDFLFPAFSHQTVYLNSMQLVHFWSQCSVCMNPAPTDMSCAQFLPALPRKGISPITFALITNKQARPVDLMPKALQGSEMSLAGIKQTGM